MLKFFAKLLNSKDDSRLCVQYHGIQLERHNTKVNGYRDYDLIIVERLSIFLGKKLFNLQRREHPNSNLATINGKNIPSEIAKAAFDVYYNPEDQEAHQKLKQELEKH